MKILCLKYFRHINQIIQIMQPDLSPRSRRSKSQLITENGSRSQPEHHLQQELQSLKLNIQNLLKYCNKLQNRNKIKKRSFSSSNQILEQNNYVIGEDDYIISSNHNLSDRYGFMDQRDSQEQISKLNQELRKTRQLYLGSLNKIHQFKTEISYLKKQLNQTNKIYNQQHRNESIDPFGIDLLQKDGSLASKYSGNMSNSIQQIDMENLLCHQDLNVEKQNCFLRANNDQTMVESLIAKGIEFREQRTLRSDEFKSLSTIVEKYRKESMSHSGDFARKRNNISLYR